MTHRAAAVVTVNLLRAGAALERRLRDQRGQGTVEYVGLILLVAGVLAAVVVWARSKAGDQQIGRKVTEQLRNAIDQTAGAKK
jgi:Flp pilus assembly pilin Flp